MWPSDLVLRVFLSKYMSWSDLLIEVCNFAHPDRNSYRTTFFITTNLAKLRHTKNTHLLLVLQLRVVIMLFISLVCLKEFENKIRKTDYWKKDIECVSHSGLPSIPSIIPLYHVLYSQYVCHCLLWSVISFNLTNYLYYICFTPSEL